MSPDLSLIDVAPSEWHTVRPWSARLSLSVREITSVSATFTLSSSFSDHGGGGEPELSLASLGIVPDDDDDDDDEFDGNADVDGGRAIISDALAKGLSVNVNGNPWSKVIFHIDDKADEAIIIIYALMPGRQYDIDLGLVHGGQNLRSQVVTEASDPPEFEQGPSPEASLPTPSTPTNPAVQTYTSVTLEERLSQLQHNLSVLNTEHESLTTNLKVSRRDSQKADAALRSEIDILRRTSEKNAVAEHRARQKVLALQEAVKRAQAATAEIHQMVKEVEGALPGLRDQKKAKEVEFAKVKESADRARKEVEKEKEKERKRIDVLKNELVGLGNRMDKLNGKKEKLESHVIPDLEDQLREIEREIERIERDPYGQLGYGEENEIVTSGSRQNSPGTIGRPSQTAIQRPTWTTPSRPSRRPSINSSNPLPPPPPPSSSRTTQTSPSQPPQARRSPSHNRSLSGGSSSQIISISNTSQNQVTASTASMSTLSSKAPPFEPGRPIRSMAATAKGSMNTTNSNPIPIQRPSRYIHGSKDSLLTNISR